MVIMPTGRRLKKMQKVLQTRQHDLTVVCENIHDPHNVSAILRTCDAVGISTVHLLYTRESFPALGKKSSASAIKWLEFQQHRNHSNLRQFLKSRNMTIYATHINRSAKTIYQVDWTKPSAIILGNEHRGVSEDSLQISDFTVKIPMLGMIESLNVSVAAAVILYEIFRQRLQAGMLDQSADENWVKQKLETWIKSVKLK
jgi:tRNA (guanosine-2'-O-)-methyltransferase